MKYYCYRVDGSEARAMTKLHKNGEDAAREPAIAHTLTGDIYIAPTPPKDTGRMEMGDIFAYRYDDVTMENQPDGTMAVTASVSTKPFIYLLWSGAVAASLGCFLAMRAMHSSK